MSKIIAVVIFIILFIVLGFFIGKSCDGDNSLPQAYEQIEKNITEINKSMKALQDSISALAELRIETKNYYNYEITKIDCVYFSGGSVAKFDSTIRYWTDYIYGLDNFFAKPFRVIPNSTDSTADGELLPSSKYLRERERLDFNSAW